MLSKLKEPVSGLTHLIGALLSVVALVVLIAKAHGYGTPLHLAAFSVFGSSLVLLYTASSLYHLLPLSEKGSRMLRRIDHTMIFVLIAGTYTPICLIALKGVWGWSLLGGVWFLAAAGVVMKLLWLHAPRWLSTAFYLLMGWLVVVAAWPLVEALQPLGLVWLAAGGLFYTAGALIYWLKRPNIRPGLLGFHEIFHLLVMAGSFSHFWMMYRYI